MPIFDQGYQHWEGQLGGRTQRWWAITRHGIRAGVKGRWLRLILLAAWVPSLAMTVVLCIWGLIERQSAVIKSFTPMLRVLSPQLITDPRQYRVVVWTLSYHYFLAVELWFAMILILFVGPNLISGDLRFNALPLYFSRPLRRIDYFLGKLGVIFALIALVLIAPSIIAYVLGIAFSLDFTILRDTLPILFAAITYGVVVTLSAGLIVLAMSALSRNSRYVAMMWIFMWIVSSVLAVVLGLAQAQQRQHAYFEYRMATNARMRARYSANNRPARIDPAQAEQEWVNFQMTEVQASKTDWRPIVSYTDNLARLSDELLGTESCWEKISLAIPETGRADFLLRNGGPQYPWRWSAGVLAGLAGLSALILNFTVKSLDRLK